MTASTSPLRKRIATALTAVALLLACAVAIVGSDAALAGARGLFGHGGPGPHGDPERWREFAAFRVEWMLRQVDATPEQREQIAAILDALVEDLGAMRGDRDALHEALRTELTAETLDRDVLERIRARHIEAIDAASRRVLDALVAAGDILEPEQRLALLERAERFHRR